MRNRASLLLLLPFAWLLSCCGTSPSNQSAYVYSGKSQVAFLTWTADQGHIQSGEMQTDRREGRGSDAAPYHNTNTLDGDVRGHKVTLRLAGGLVTMTGDMSGDSLTLKHVPMSDETVQTQTWQAGTQAQYQQVQAAFDAYVGVSATLSTLKAHLALLPPDSDPGSLHFQAVAVQDDVSSLSAGVKAVQAATTAFERCSAYALNVEPYLLSASAFQAPDPKLSTIAQDVAQVQRRSDSAVALPVPNINGLMYPWKLSTSEVTTQLQPGKETQASFEQAANQEQRELNERKRQYDQLLSEIDITSLQSSCS
jgi:hypothetical protein